MLKPGTIFCPYCCKTHTIPRYTSGSYPVGVDLHHKGQKYGIVERLIPNNDPTNNDPPPALPIGIQLESVVESEFTGLPETIIVTYPGASNPVRMWRACPHCFRKYDLAAMGTLPTFIIGMVGVRSSGKSALLNSMAFRSHVRDVNVTNYPITLDIYPEPDKHGVAKATVKLGRGMTKLITLQNRSTLRPIAHVLLLDVSGELFGDAKNYDTTQHAMKYNPEDIDELTNILSGTGGYHGVDAVIFADPVPGSKDNTSNALMFNATQIMNNCRLLNPNFANLPMAYVFTHLDHYNNNIKDFPSYKKDPNGSRSYPLLSPQTFLNTSYAPDRLIDRIYTEDSIARSLPEFVPMGRNLALTKGFLVSSCHCETRPGFGDVEDYTYSRNVMDPLLWILNKLRLFPLTNGG